MKLTDQEPRRGGLFIANTLTPFISFCFSAARTSIASQEKPKALIHSPRSNCYPAAQPKNKKGCGLDAAGYKQANTTGFEPRPSIQFVRSNVVDHEFRVGMGRGRALTCWAIVLGL